MTQSSSMSHMSERSSASTAANPIEYQEIKDIASDLNRKI